MNYNDAGKLAHATAFKILREKGQLNTEINFAGLKEVRAIQKNVGEKNLTDFAVDRKGTATLGRSFSEKNFKETGLNYTPELAEKFGALYAAILASRVNDTDFKAQDSNYKNVNVLAEDKFARETTAKLLKTYKSKFQNMNLDEIYDFGQNLAKHPNIPFFRQPAEGITAQQIDESIKKANKEAIDNAGKAFDKLSHSKSTVEKPSKSSGVKELFGVIRNFFKQDPMKKAEKAERNILKKLQKNMKLAEENGTTNVSLDEVSSKVKESGVTIGSHRFDSNTARSEDNLNQNKDRSLK
ncbi:MAG: hypothetical protein J0G32_08125 [Alphaproteobacteria bacterium]|nr:hypothetical protein [Alphaproteobacteria bacterium]OJV15345.1 MAG: hypothetical protein BGO27_02430 [Alphaproteobacteria bacterium 33-17]